MSGLEIHRTASRLRGYCNAFLVGMITVVLVAALACGMVVTVLTLIILFPLLIGVATVMEIGKAISSRWDTSAATKTRQWRKRRDEKLRAALNKNSSD